jgi:hypothetical protein
MALVLTKIKSKWGGGEESIYINPDQIVLVTTNGYTGTELQIHLANGKTYLMEGKEFYDKFYNGTKLVERENNNG